MTFKATPFADLPVSTEEAWDPGSKGLTAIMNEVLGDADDPNWERYKRAHLVWDSENAETKAGYKLPVARMVDGTLTVIPGQVSSAIGAINGARGGVSLPTQVRRNAYDRSVQYLEKAGIEEDDVPGFKGARFGRPVKCDTPTPGAAKWQHVAREGDYLGYWGGERPFSFGRDTLEEMVANFRASPAYHAGDDGVGDTPVIAWDFNHASEAYEADGSMPVTGAPAQGWVVELEVRSAADGSAQLWALTEWLETAAQYIKNNQYRWASVSVIRSAVDAETGAQIGAVLTSIAMTNTPFIEGMIPLAASKLGPNHKLRCYYFEAAKNAEEAVESLKDLLNLPATTSMAAISVQLATLAEWLEAGSTPAGIDLSELIGNMRTIMGLPTLTQDLAVLGSAMEITQRLVDEQAAQAGDGSEGDADGDDLVTPGGFPSPRPQAKICPFCGKEYFGNPDFCPPCGQSLKGFASKTAAMASEPGGMDMTLLKTLAKKLGVHEGDEQVINAVDTEVQLRAQLTDTLGAQPHRNGNDVLVAEVVEAVAAKASLSALHESLGVTTQGDATKAIVDLLAKAKQYDEAEPELTQLRDQVDAAAKAEAEADVDEVMLAQKLPDQVRTALLQSRLDDPEAFAATFPKLGAGKTALTQKVNQVNDPEAKPEVRDDGVVDLSKYPGRNGVDKAMKHLLATQEGFANLPYRDRWQMGCELNRKVLAAARQ
jgi:hypothetical protein